MPARRYTEEQFRAAVADPGVRTMADLCRALDLVPRGANYETLRRYAARLEVDLDHHLRRPLRMSLDPERLRRAVADSISMAATLRTLGYGPSSARYRAVQRQIEHLGLCTDHWLGQGWAAGARRPSRRQPLEAYLKANRTVMSSKLRRRLIEEGVKEHECEHCGHREWQGYPVPLELDHVNGDRTDNRIENLRLLCPNCHALTPTYRGRNIGRTRARGGESPAWTPPGGNETPE